MAGSNSADKQQITAIGKPFPKGVSGNPAGRPKRKTLTELIHAKLDETQGGWDAIVKTAISKALTDKEVLRTLWQYTDGMPKQAVDVTSKGEQVFSGADYIGEHNSKTDTTTT